MSDDNKKDLTRIEDLSDFFHQEDEETDSILSENTSQGNTLPDLPIDSDIEEAEASFEPEENSFAATEDENEEEASFDMDFSDSDEDNSEFLSSDDENESDNQEEEELQNDFTDTDQENTEDFQEDTIDHTLDLSTSETENEDGEEQEALDEMVSNDLEQPSFAEGPQEITTIQPPSFQETKEQIQDFAENINYGAMSDPGNPPYSIIIKNIKYQEDIEDIIIILRDFSLINQSNETDFKKSLENGQALLSRLSEYCAIILCNKLRRFDINIQMGLSDELHQSKSDPSLRRGVITKHNLKQNKRENIKLRTDDVNIDDIQLSTTPTLQGHKIIRYMGLVSEEMVFEETILEQNQYIPPIEQANEILNEISSSIRELKQENISDRNDDNTPTREIYANLADKLKTQALLKNGNAVVGIQYTTTPISNSQDESVKLKVTCVGSVVWASPL